jgi:hypothetical protein
MSSGKMRPAGRSLVMTRICGGCTTSGNRTTRTSIPASAYDKEGSVLAAAYGLNGQRANLVIALFIVTYGDTILKSRSFTALFSRTRAPRFLKPALKSSTTQARLKLETRAQMPGRTCPVALARYANSIISIICAACAGVTRDA